MSVRAFPGATAPRRPEHRHTFACFGGQCTVIVADAARPADAAVAAAMAKRALLAWHRRFSRFTEDSELSRVNRDPAATVAVSPLMRRVIEAALTAARDTGGLVDATLADEIERAGYAGHFDGEGIDLRTALALAPPRGPPPPIPASAGARSPSTRAPGPCTVHRVCASTSAASPRACSPMSSRRCSRASTPTSWTAPGTSASAGAPDWLRPVHIAGPFDADRAAHPRADPWRGGHQRHLPSQLDRRRRPSGPPPAGPLHRSAGVHRHRPGHAPSRRPPPRPRCWRRPRVLSGPHRAAQWLRHGGVIVCDDGSYVRLEPGGVRGRGAHARAQPAHDVVEHRLALGLVEDLVEEALVGLDGQVGGADPLAEHHAARRACTARRRCRRGSASAR